MNNQKQDDGLKVSKVDYDSLTTKEQQEASNNGSGKECANYLRVEHNGQTIALESDAMEPEDARFSRDLAWIPDLLLRAYKLGRADAELGREAKA